MAKIATKFAKIKILRDPVEISRGKELIIIAKSNHQGKSFFKTPPQIS
jgi:hypothetical protein